MDNAASTMETVVGSSTNDAETRVQRSHPGKRRSGGGSGGGGGVPRRQGDTPRPPRRQQDNAGGGGGGGEGNWVWDRFEERLQHMAGPTFDLPPVDGAERKFASRNRLYVGNVGGDVAEPDLLRLFSVYGEVSEVFINKEKNFAFVKLDYHANAVRAKRELDGTSFNQRNIKVRFSPSGFGIKVKNLTPYVTNELLNFAFSIFGEVEKATVLCDDKGRPTGEGIVEFVKKGSATYALKKCQEECFFLTSSLRPIVVEPTEVLEDPDGFSDKAINRKSQEFMACREVGPRFAFRGSFEQQYGMKWKSLYELYKQKEEALKKEFDLEKEKLEAQMEYARYEHETEVLREQLRARELDKERQKREWEHKERMAEQEKRRAEERFRRQQETMLRRQEDEVLRREQENSLFVQAHNLDSILDQQEHAFEGAYAPAQSPAGYGAATAGGGGGGSVFSSVYEAARGSGGDPGRWMSPGARDDDPPSKQKGLFAGPKRVRRF